MRRTIQAVIDDTAIFKPDERFWKLGLFNEDGTPLSLGGSGSDSRLTSFEDTSYGLGVGFQMPDGNRAYAGPALEGWGVEHYVDALDPATIDALTVMWPGYLQIVTPDVDDSVSTFGTGASTDSQNSGRWQVSRAGTLKWGDGATPPSVALGLWEGSPGYLQIRQPVDNPTAEYIWFGADPSDDGAYFGIGSAPGAPDVQLDTNRLQFTDGSGNMTAAFVLNGIYLQAFDDPAKVFLINVSSTGELTATLHHTNP